MQWLFCAEISVDDIGGSRSNLPFVGMILLFRILAKQAQLVYDALHSLMIDRITAARLASIPDEIAVSLYDAPAKALATSPYFSSAVHTLF
ncbi:MAG: hypothetical protein Q4B32_11705 [Clostridia bacterium]|nr:hypothetical protein [Clostridia bacterium]